MTRQTDRLIRIDDNVQRILDRSRDNPEVCPHGQLDSLMLESLIKDSILDTFDSIEASTPLGEVHSKLNHLIRYVDRDEKMRLDEQTMDKFDDYMRNVDKLNAMVNEFKGCVSMSRASLVDSKELVKALAEIKEAAELAHSFHAAISSFMIVSKKMKCDYHIKIDAIYKTLCKKKPKRPCSIKKISRKKKAVS